MGLFLQQSDSRTKLQSRLAEELKEKVKAAQQSPTDHPVEPELLADERQTRPAGMVIAALVFVAIVAIGVIIALNI